MAGINPGVGASSASSGGSVNDGVDSAIKATVLDLTASNPLTVAITDGTGAQITSFGGGTQYADGAARGTATGTLGMVDDGTLIQSMKGDSSGRPAMNVEQINGVAPSMGNGISGTGVQRVTLASDSTGTVSVTNTGTFLVQADTELPAAAVLSDSDSNPTVPGVGGFTMLWNSGASQWTRAQQTITSRNTAGTGLLASQIIAKFDDVTPTSVTENNFGNLRMSSTGVLYGTIRDAAGNERGANVTASGELNTIAAQSGTWTVQPGNTANTTAWKVDGSAVTQPVSGTVTATIAAGATTIAKAEDTASADADVGVPAMAIRKATPANTSGTDGDYEMLQVSAGRLWASATIDAALPAGTSLVGKVGFDQTTPGTTNAVSIAQLGSNTVATGNGASSTGVLRVAQVNDGTGVIATVSTVSNLASMSGNAIAMNSGVRSAGAQRVTICTDDVVPASQSGTWTLQPGNTANTTPWLVSTRPATTGGLSKFHLVSAATTNATNVKASAGQVYGIVAFNLNASARYLKFHNTAGTPTAGTGVTDTYLIPGNTAGAGLVINFNNGIAFSTGIGITLVTGITDADAVAVAASEIVLQIYYA